MSRQRFVDRRSERDYAMKVMEHTSHALRKDRDVVMVAVALGGATLKFAAGKLRADREVVLTAIASDALALEHASAGLWRAPLHRIRHPSPAAGQGEPHWWWRREPPVSV